MPLHLRFGSLSIRPRIVRGEYLGLGAIKVGGVPLRRTATRFMPWLDTYDGLIFRRFRFRDADLSANRAVLHLSAIGEQDHPFRERRDCSGDLVFREGSWDAAEVEADFRVIIEPTQAEHDGLAFSGFRYHYEFASEQVAIHRLLDRQTWAPGGTLADSHLHLRTWLTPGRVALGPEVAWSTVGLDKWSNLLPGCLWARWSLLPGFELLQSPQGLLLGAYERVSSIRAMLATAPGEDELRVQDLHQFASAKQAATPPKSILWSPAQLSSVATINLWTRLHDADREQARAQFGIPDEGAPLITFSKNIWQNFHLDSSYDDALAAATELGAEALFIDPVWENGETVSRTLNTLIPESQRQGTVLERVNPQNMCCTIDPRVPEIIGGEAALTRLCQRANAQGVRVLSWLACHFSPQSHWRREAQGQGHGLMGVFAAKESGRHPDTGYPGECWTLNLNAPIRDYLRDQVLGLCARTGLGGFLWDSFSNLGWWQVDYSDGTMTPQAEAMARLYAEWARAGLYLMPEGIAAFSGHNCIGQHGGDIYPQGELAAYAYHSQIGLARHGQGQLPLDQRILKGEVPVDELFQAFAHLWVPTSELWRLPRAQWHPAGVAALRDLYAVYRQVRPLMRKRTVLEDGLGVRWTGPAGAGVLWAFRPQPTPPGAREPLTGTPITTAELRANQVVLLAD